jgi:hypothetical protein
MVIDRRRRRTTKKRKKHTMSGPGLEDERTARRTYQSCSRTKSAQNMVPCAAQYSGHTAQLSVAAAAAPSAATTATSRAMYHSDRQGLFAPAVLRHRRAHVAHAERRWLPGVEGVHLLALVVLRRLRQRLLNLMIRRPPHRRHGWRLCRDGTSDSD